MTLDEIEQAARAIEDRRTGSLTFEVTVNLARAVLAMLPVVRAAGELRDRADRCVDRPWMGCAMDHSTIESWLADEVDRMRAAIGEGE